MPKPLSQINKTAHTSFSPSSLCNQHLQASQVMRVIACWAQIDQTKASLISRILKADVVTVTAMLNSIKSEAAKDQAFLTAAKRCLPEWQCVLIEAVAKATKPSKMTRNKFVHWIWGKSDDLGPDFFLLADPIKLVERQLKPNSDNQHKAGDILVYTKAEIKNASDKALDATGIYGGLWMTIGLTVEQGRRQLLRTPEVASAIQILSKRKSPEVQELLRPPTDLDPTPKEIIDWNRDNWHLFRNLER